VSLTISLSPLTVFWLLRSFSTSTLPRRPPCLSSTASHARRAISGPPSLPGGATNPAGTVAQGGLIRQSAQREAESFRLAPCRLCRGFLVPPWLAWPFALPLCRTREFAPLCVSVVRVVSSTLLPGFLGPESSVLSVDLPPFAPLPAAGSPFASQFSTAHERRRAGGLPGVRHTASPYPVQLQCTAGTPIGYWDLLCHACSSPAIHPSSWFAVRYVHGFCLRLPSDIPFLGMPLPSVGVPLPSDHGGFQVAHLLFSACVSCPAHVSDLRQSRWLEKG